MKFPSLSQLSASFLAVCKRFTLPILYALLATIAALILSYQTTNFDEEQALAKFIYLGNFGLALSFAFCLFAENRLLSFTKKLLVNIAVFALLVVIYFALDPAIYQADVFILLILGFAFHLLVAFSAFSSQQEDLAFWQINKIFFLRFATSALYSAVLFGGLSIALLSINTLFNVKWDSEIYLRLWIIIVGLFNTVFFLAGIPKPLSQLNSDTAYPKALKVFTQYVLIPLASIYLLILLAYEIKIVLEWSLPTSSVAVLILGYAVFGMLSILLVHPIRNQQDNKWIKLYSRNFYLLMLPLLVLLAISIVKRVTDYGITESRYLLIILSLWLTFITGYFLIKGQEQIRIVPISLFIFSILIVVGPWSIKQVSLRSQSNRLASYVHQKQSAERNEEIRNLVRYLNENYGSKSLQPFVKIDLKAIEEKKKNTKKGTQGGWWETKKSITDTVLVALKVGKLDTDKFWKRQQKNYQNAEMGVLSVEGAVKVVSINSSASNQDTTAFTLEDKRFTLMVDKSYNLVLVGQKSDKYVFKIADLLKKLYKNKGLKINGEYQNITVPNSMLVIEYKHQNYIFKLRLETLNAFYPEKSPSNPNNIYYNGYLIIYPNL